MNMEKNVKNRELFVELFENPIHPLQIHMVPPFVDKQPDLLQKLNLLTCHFGEIAFGGQYES